MVLGGVDTFAQSQYLFKNPVINSMTDFVPAGLAVQQPLVLVVRKDLPVNNLKEFVDYVKVNQAKMTFGSAGVGAAPHLACYMVTAAIGATAVTHVPYRSSAPALQDLIAGTIDYYCPVSVAAMPLIANKSAKVLAVLTASHRRCSRSCRPRPSRGSTWWTADTGWDCSCPRVRRRAW